MNAIISSIIAGIFGIIGTVLNGQISAQRTEKSILSEIAEAVSQSNDFSTKQDLFAWIQNTQKENDHLYSHIENLETETKEVRDMIGQMRMVPSMEPEEAEDNTDVDSSVVESSDLGFSESGNYTDNDFFVEVKVRFADDPDVTWKDSVEANVGDRVEFQMQYKNLSDIRHPSVIVRNILPDSLRYIEGFTYLFNTVYPEGAHINEDSIIDTGVNIGNYLPGANGYIRITAEVEADDEKDGPYVLVNWAQGQAGAVVGEQYVLQDYATVNVDYGSPKK